jgi:DNA (cytosine-5)-methyltransferase 1
VIASFFSGIGGLEIGLEAAGLGPTVFQCELDPYARGVLERHWPAITRHDDITTLQPAAIPYADVWCGGFPCQDISVANREGIGIEGDRSGLWFAWLELIRVARPDVVVVENVSALLGRGLGDVLRGLSEAGYDAEWETFAASDVGAPHLRQRTFVIAYSPDAVGSRLAEWEGVRGYASTELEAAIRGSRPDVRWWTPEPNVVRVVHGFPAQLRQDRIRCLGNSVVPQCAELVGRRVTEILAGP